MVNYPRWIISVTIFLKHVVAYKRRTHDLVPKIRNYRKKVGALKNRMDSIKGHSLRNNSILHGIEGNVSENWDGTERKVRNFLCDSLEWIEADSVQIERAHR